MDQVKLAVTENTFNILRIVHVNLFYQLSDIANCRHKSFSEVRVDQELLLVVIDSKLGLFLHGVRIEKSRAGETWEVLAVGITSENKAFGHEAHWFVRITVEFGGFCLLVVSEAKGLTRHV